MRNVVGLIFCTKSTAMIFLVILTTWIALSLLVIGVCFAARLGDQAQHEPASASAPATHTTRRQRRTATLAGGLGSARERSVR